MIMGNTFQKYYSEAERKTSLGRDWHPTCLRCVQCGRVLSPGQHAEHKGNPYCHTPCYQALFGPSLLGYGSNVASPANFARKDNAAEFGHDYDDDVYKREIYSNSRTSAAAAARRRQQRQSAPPSIVGHNFSALTPNADTYAGTSLAKGGGGEGKRGGVPSSTHSLDMTRGESSLDDSSSHSMSTSRSQPVIESVVNNVSNASKSNPSSSSASSSVAAAKVAGSSSISGHSRSKSEQVLPSDSRLGSFVVPHQCVAGEDDLVVVPVIRSPPSSNSRSTAGYHAPGNSTTHAVHGGGGGGSGYLWPALKRDIPPALRDIIEKVESFNSHYEGKVHHQMTIDQTPGGEVLVRGPLRIYWGLSRPIQLRQCDDVPALPISKWRHSLCANLNEGVGQNSNSPSQKSDTHGTPGFLSPHRPLRGIDDCVLLSPSSSADEVVMRRQKVRKFNTVAYRSDAPTRWKRASINGHVFNYDTSVFTPVLGSSTSVIIDSSMTSPVVIKTLLEKFKVENSPKEYVLSVVTEKGDQTSECLLGESDRPLLERLQLGADDHYAKIFLKERTMEPEAIVPDTVKLPIMEEEEEETLPAEVEQLMILPVAVLKGIMIKLEKDEEREVRLLKAKYERVRRKINKRLEEMATA